MKGIAAAGLACLALQAAPPPYRPDPKAWRLEVTPDLGGWLTTASVPITVKLVDPRDPAPPREGAFQEPEAGLDEAEDAGDGPDPALARARYQALRNHWEEERVRNEWRQRQLRVWFNGAERREAVQVGYPWRDTLACQNGENRLELFEPDSGLRVVRTWWASAGRTRLQIAAVHSSGEYWNGRLEVMEPNGDVGGPWRKTPSGGVAGWNSFTHPRPPAGTYTLRWTDVPRYGAPCTVVVEVLLDGGTEQERRWRFARLVLPGAGPVTLGTVDVEN